MIGRTIRKDVQHGGVCWSLSAVNKQFLCVWYCTTVSDYTGRPSREENKRSTVFRPMTRTHIHTQHTRDRACEKFHLTLRLSLRFTRHTYVHTHTDLHARPLPMSDWAGERGPLPASGKNPHHPQV